MRRPFPAASAALALFLALFSAVACIGPFYPTATPPGPTPTQPPFTPPPTTTPTPTRVATPTPTVDPSISLEALAGLLDQMYERVVERVKPAVVSIVVQSLSYNIFLRPVPQEGAGSGVIFDANGYIITNFHVIEDAQSIKVTLTDGRTFDAVVVGSDPETDLAVINIQGEGFPTIPLGASVPPRQGHRVIAVGNALALPGGPTVTDGVISSLGRSIQEPNGVVLNDLIQTSAAINPGNSGGALVNLAGEVIGINTAIASSAEGIGFAIDIDTAKPIIRDLLEHGRVVRAWLGVGLLTVTPSVASTNGLSVSEGVLLTAVESGSPADMAGLREGDVITHFGGQKMTTYEDLRTAIRSRKAGDTAEVTYVRGTDTLTTAVTLGQAPSS